MSQQGHKNNPGLKFEEQCRKHKAMVARQNEVAVANYTNQLRILTRCMEKEKELRDKLERLGNSSAGAAKPTNTERELAKLQMWSNTLTDAQKRAKLEQELKDATEAVSSQTKTVRRYKIPVTNIQWKKKQYLDYRVVVDLLVKKKNIPTEIAHMILVQDFPSRFAQDDDL